MSQSDGSSFTRRQAAFRIAVASGAAIVPLPAFAGFGASAEVEPAVTAALAASPAPLEAAERMDVRNGVRSLARALAAARSREVPNDVDPAFVYLPSGGAR